MKSVLLGFFCLALMGTLLCQQGPDPAAHAALDSLKAHAGWAQEPSSFLGIKFGEPLSAAVSECPTDYIGNHKFYAAYKTREICYEPVADFFKVNHVDNFFDVYVHEVDGKVASITAHFPENNAATMEEALEGKFGKPHSTKQEEVRTRMNVAYTKISNEWFGANVVIDFESIGSQVDEGYVTVSTAAYWKFLEDKKNAQKEKLKSSF
ncbi:hypothetical protein Acid345_3392 [Candidatus Koribacter versatilis Ellin345]|uniref:Lipoprotein n=1 Tax=Koribacter versatilis (strain Ellin345) TaxID=204669 RepID=Q1IL57_KORVE|nr:hypothetical protein [Candidatus Koribacter versatilis]ABF42393.1 hypothetical protein Acid345_3392 [Candidatus Koribacter versatilis Ellin345]